MRGTKLQSIFKPFHRSPFKKKNKAALIKDQFQFLQTFIAILMQIGPMGKQVMRLASPLLSLRS